MRRPTGACSARLPDRIRIRIKRWRSRLPKHSDTMMMRCSPANFLGWVIRSGTKPCHKTHCRCPHRLNLSFRSGRSCALPNVKALKDKGLEFANSIRPLSTHETRGAFLPVWRAQKLSPQINVEFVAGQEVLGQRSEATGPLNATQRATGKGGAGQSSMCALV